MLASWSVQADESRDSAQSQAMPDAAGSAAGSVGGNGAFSVSLPLELPPARGESLPVPLSVTYIGGSELGTAGLGWSVQESSISFYGTRAHHPQPEQIVELELLGEHYVLYEAGKVAGGVEYRPLVGSRNLVATRRELDWLVRDDGGRSYVFEYVSPGEGRRRLTSISDVDGNTVTLEYETFSEPPPAGVIEPMDNRAEAVLGRIRYSFLPGSAETPTCPKYSIDLGYRRASELVTRAPAYGAFADFTSGRTRLRQRVLTEIVIRSATGCESSERLRSYLLSYSTQPELGLPLLSRVDQLGVGESNPALAAPLVSYGYASLIGATGSLRFGSGSSLVAPGGGPLFISQTRSSTPVQELMDLNGDGLPDLVSRSKVGGAYQTWLHRGLPQAAGSLALVLNAVAAERLNVVQVGVVDPPVPVDATGSYRFIAEQPGGQTVLIDGYRYDAMVRYLDWNGDGRTDIVSAQQDGVTAGDGKPRLWTVYLNQASADGSAIAWKRIQIDVSAVMADMEEEMPLSALAFENGWNQSLCQQECGAQYFPCLAGCRNQCELDCAGDLACELQCDQSCDQSCSTMQTQCTSACYAAAPNLTVAVNPTGLMPLGRQTKVSYHGTCRSYAKEGSQHRLRETPCPADEWISEWKLQDVNGDGYPDLVRNATAALPHVSSCEACPSTTSDPNGLAPACRSGCVDGLVDDLTTTSSKVLVYYHPGPELTVDGATWTPKLLGAPDGADTLYDGSAASARSFGRACGLERVRVFPSTLRSYSACSFEDVDGDGVADYLTETTEPYRGAEGNGRIQVALRGTAGSYRPHKLRFDSATALLLPGPVDVQTNGKRFCPGAGTIKRQQLTGLIDVNGDGRRDYVYFGLPTRLDSGEPLRTLVSAQLPAEILPVPAVASWPSLAAATPATATANATTSAWYVRFNNGAVFGASVPIEPPVGASMAIRESLLRCEGAELVTEVGTGLFDVDADGIPELVNQAAGGLVAWRLRDDQAMQAGIAQVPAPGRLTEVRNSQLGGFHLAYGSAKAYLPWARSSLPSPEVVVAKSWRSFGKGLAQGDTEQPTFYYFGSGSLVFDPVWRRTVSGGYRAMVESRAGAQGPEGLVRWRLVSNQHPLMTYAMRGAFTGVGRFQGGQQAWQMLGHGESIGVHPSVTGADSNTPELRSTRPFDDDRLWLPSTHALLLTSTAEDHWRGDAPPVQWSSPSVARRARLLEVDVCGRQTKIVDQGAVRRGDDDVCQSIEYVRACETAPVPLATVRRLDAPRRIRVHTCDTNQTLSVIRFAYDKLAEGQLAKGHPTQVTFEVYDLETKAKLDEYVAESRSYDEVGNVTVLAKRLNHAGLFGLWNLTAAQEFDAWRLAPALVTTQTFGGADVLSERTSYDPVTMAPVSVIDASGVERRTSYDRFVRPTRTSIVDPASGVEYLLSTIDYLGEDPRLASDWALGRRVRTRTMLAWVPVGASPAASQVEESTAFFDEVGRVRFVEEPLGADYGGAVMVSGYVEWDALGRKRFEADPFVRGEWLQSLYGTTSRYFADGSVRCSIRSERGRAYEIGSSEFETAPTCVERSYVDGNLVTRTRGPAELTSGSPAYGAYDETVTTATGRVLSAARVAGGVRQSYEEFGYDAMGNQRRIARSQSPSTGGQMTEWLFAHDSRGLVRRRTEPGLALVNHDYDLVGKPTRTWWTNGQGAVEEVRVAYDGHERRIQVTGLRGGVVQNQVTYGYDAAAPDPRHDFAAFLPGRLAYATSASGETVFYGYGFDGQATTIAWTQEALGPELVMEQFERGPSGRLERLAFARPGSAAIGDEAAEYLYDSASRLRGVDWATATGAETLWTAAVVSPRGEVERQLFGNGVRVDTRYAQSRRRLLVDEKLSYVAPPLVAATSTVAVSGWDIAGRRTGIKESRSEWGAVSVETLYDYDALNHLARERKRRGSVMLVDRGFGFDPLGNLVLRRDNLAGKETRFAMRAASPDQLCSVAVVAQSSWLSPPAVPPKGSTPPPCSYVYDASGRLASEQVGALGAAASGALRSFQYDPQGRPTEVSVGGVTGRIDYGAGGVSALEILGQGGALLRRDTRFGGDIERSMLDGAPVWEYRIPGATGTVARVRALRTGTKIVYAHGDGRFDMQVSSDGGLLTQRTSFDAWGAPTDEQGTPGSSGYVKVQWNGADTLEGLGVLHMGVRLYDPTLGRFLQRDPLIVPRKADEVNPYAYAHGDPVNKADPTGMDPAMRSDCPPPFCAIGQQGGGAADGAANLRAELLDSVRPTVMAAVSSIMVDNPVMQFSLGLGMGLVSGPVAMVQAVLHPIDTAVQLVEGVQGAYSDAGGGVSGVLAVVESVSPAAALRDLGESWRDGDYFGAGMAVGAIVPMAAAAVATSGSANGIALPAAKGARGLWGGRPFDPSLAGGPIRRLRTEGVRVTARGIDVVEGHVARFGPDAANAGMIARLRRIEAGKLKATQADMNFYTHELRESVRYRRMGFRIGGGHDYELWNNAHTATLADYGLVEGPGVLYHPSVAP